MARGRGRGRRSTAAWALVPEARTSGGYGREVLESRPRWMREVASRTRAPCLLASKQEAGEGLVGEQAGPVPKDRGMRGERMKGGRMASLGRHPASPLPGLPSRRTFPPALGVWPSAPSPSWTVLAKCASCGDTESALSGGDHEQTLRATRGGDMQAAGGDTEGQESLWMRFVPSGDWKVPQQRSRHEGWDSGNWEEGGGGRCRPQGLLAGSESRAGAGVRG